MNNGDMPASPAKKRNGAGGFHYLRGLTKREHFAAMAMQGCCSDADIDWDEDTIAKYAVKQADALLAALESE